MFGFSKAVTIAWREARSSPGKFLFVILAVAAGVGAVSGVRGFASAFRSMLLKDARILMAGDISVRLFNQADAVQMAALDEIVAGGAERTWITETVSMMSSESSSRPLLVAVKAVEPSEYPYYGEIELRPAGALREVLDESSVVATDDLLLRLGVDVGEQVQVGEAQFRLAAVLTVEPDRMTGTMNVGPRLMMSRAGLDRAGLIQRGSRAAQRYLFKLPEDGVTVAAAYDRLANVFGRRWVADYRDTHPTIRRGLDRATNFLSLVSLIAMIIGALGVAMAMYSHLQQRLDTIAIMKCIGARSSQILRIYVIQTLALGLAGSLLGVGIGFVVQVWMPALVANYFPTAPEIEWQPVAALQGIVIGVLTTLLFSVPPLLSIRRIRPALILRRDMESLSKTWRQKLAESGSGLVTAVVIVVALGGVATWLGDSAELGLWFAGGLVASLLVLTATAWGLLQALRKLPALLPLRMPTAIRHGLANLYRPGAHAEAILVALGVGVTFTLSVYLIQSSVLTQMVKSAPPDMPNVFLLNITDEEKDGLEELMKGYPGIDGDLELIPSVAARLTTIDGVSLEDMQLGREAARYRQTRGLTWHGEKPEEIDLMEGAWWSPEEQEIQAAVREDVAETLGIRLGSNVEWLVGARTITAKVQSIYRVESIRPGSSSYFVLTPSSLEGLPATYYGAVRIEPEKAFELQRDAFEQFPAVMVINAADVLTIVQEVVDQIALVVQFVSAFAILGGVIILTSSVVATRFRRIRETAVIKTLGATKRKVPRIFSVEFLVIGGVAGLMGGLLASGFSALLLEQVLDAQFEFDYLPNIATVLATALIAQIAGWLASFRILDRRPLEVLRGE